MIIHLPGGHASRLDAAEFNVSLSHSGWLHQRITLQTILNSWIDMRWHGRCGGGSTSSTGRIMQTRFNTQRRRLEFIALAEWIEMLTHSYPQHPHSPHNKLAHSHIICKWLIQCICWWNGGYIFVPCKKWRPKSVFFLSAQKTSPQKRTNIPYLFLCWAMARPAKRQWYVK